MHTIEGVRFRYVEPAKLPHTDFTDFITCFNILQTTTMVRPGATVSLSINLEDEDPEYDEEILIRYGFSGTPGLLAITLLDRDTESPINEDLMIFAKSNGKLTGRPLIGDLDEDSVEDIVKIIQEYGVYILEGIKWAAFLLHEAGEGVLHDYFDNQTDREIH